jgi:hydrogenase maturation protease
MRTILIGLGNPILGDDAAGWKVVEQVEQQLQPPRYENQEPIDIAYLSIGGLGLMEHLIGYDRAIIVDAMVSGKEVPGTISTRMLEDVFDLTAGHTTSVHDTSLKDAVNLARKMGVHMPKNMIVVGIATDSIYNFSEALTTQVAAAIPRAVEIVIELLTKRESWELERTPPVPFRWR